ncbi:hypothetical protein ACP28Y_001749 [Enterococcus faecalis]|nr:hypothetical protein HMPREF9505_01613 [Enterococcus faecalis TX0109]ELS0404278.1 hypothetical protein [Enterococcus faecalis]MDU8954077.1 hypothetical protein [Streptococcus sp.]
MAQMTIATRLFFPLPSKEADLKKKVMWVAVKNHVAGDEKMTGVRSKFHLHLKEGEKIG